MKPRAAPAELVGNALCLDFANTVNARPVHRRDDLATYPGLLTWSGHAGTMPPEVLARLAARAAGPDADRALADAHHLRDAIYATYSAIAAGREPDSPVLARLGAAYGDATGNAVFVRRSPAGGPPAYDVSWPAASTVRLDAPLWPVARSAGDLLLSGPLDRIGECPGCGWVFLDTSRNGSRRWCSMTTCGSRDKMARYYQRPRDVT